MWIERLRLRGWRNFGDEVLHLKEGLNALSGDNGAGKTNCLEAIGYLGRGTSFRNAHLEDLQNIASDAFLLEIAFHNGDVEHRFSVSNAKGTPVANFNGQVLRNWRGLFSTVLWLPGDTDLIKGSPAGRRRFLDEHLQQCDPLYSHHTARYLRMLKQRNQLLRAKKAKEITSCNYVLAKAGGYIVDARRLLIESLQTLVGEFFQKLEKKDRITLRYRPALAIGRGEEDALLTSDIAEQRLFALLEDRVAEEMQWGTTLFGPHRDDFEVNWNNVKARHYASNGQAKLCAAGFKIAEWQRLTDLGHSPLLLIDEFGSGLDAAHQLGIWQGFLPARQTIAACTTLQRASLAKIAKAPMHCTRIESGTFHLERELPRV